MRSVHVPYLPEDLFTFISLSKKVVLQGLDEMRELRGLPAVAVAAASKLERAFSVEMGRKEEGSGFAFCFLWAANRGLE